MRTMTPTTGGSLAIPDVVPGWLVEEVVAALPEPENAEQLWWWRPGLLEHAIPSREWLGKQIRLVTVGSFGAARNDFTGAFAQVVRIGGFAVEVGFSAEWPAQVSRDGLPDGDSVATLPDVVRGNGAPAAVRSGRRWRLGAVAAAEVAFTWVSEGRLAGGFSSRPAF